MDSVLLTHANHLYADAKQEQRMQPYPPLQLLLVAAALRRAGLNPQVLDGTFAPPVASFEKQLDSDPPGLAVICEDHFNFVTKMCLTCHRQLALEMCAAARLRGVPVLVSSSDAVDNPTRYLEAGATAVVLGEAEMTLVAAAAALLGGGDSALRSVEGLAMAGQDGRLIRTAPRARLGDLDALPWPAWDLIDLTPYRAAWRRAHGYFSLHMAASRGCPYRCNWCAKPIFGEVFRTRSARDVAAEMRWLQDRWAPDHIWFADDIFGMSRRWLKEFASEVEAAGVTLPFKIQTRCDLITRGTASDLRRAGCVEVWMGAESGSQRVLDAMEKGIRVEQIYRARSELRRWGIRAGFFLQFGYPGEGWPEIQETVRMVRETLPDDIGISVSYPLPGTRFFQIVNPHLGAKKNWSDSADLAMMFRGAYSSDFYRLLRDALHLELDISHGRRADCRAQLSDMWRQLEAMDRAAAQGAARCA